MAQIIIPIQADLLEKPADQAQAADVYAFDYAGRLLGRTKLTEKGASLEVSEQDAAGEARIFVGPGLDEGTPVTPANLSKLGAFELPTRFRPQTPIRLQIPSGHWKRWKLCSCVVTGRVVVRRQRPDGTSELLPLCKATVTIHDVDRLPWLIHKLPDIDVIRLREDLLEKFRPPIDIIRPPRPFPEPEPQPFLMIARAKKPLEIRRALLDLSATVSRKLPLWDYIERFFRYDLDVLKTVTTDEDGRFSTRIYYPCGGDKPDLYFTVDVQHAGDRVRVSEPNVRTSTYWNYACGSEVVIEVDHPLATPCEPIIPKELPPGVGQWILAFSVGGTMIWGNPAGGADAPGLGWVKKNGRTDYSEGGATYVDAPFGGGLAFRLDHSPQLANSGVVKYYRWSYRRVGTSTWTPMTTPIFRHYVEELVRPDGTVDISYPAFSVGPKNIGAQTNLFEFRPVNPPAPTTPGATTYWPVHDIFGEVYSAAFDSGPPGAGLVGTYEILFEVFSPAGAPVAPDTGGVAMLLPTGYVGNTLHTRHVSPGDLNAQGLVFTLDIDNRRTSATIDAPTVSTGGSADDCGFLRYTAAQLASTSVGLSLHAKHPANRDASYGFAVSRGTHGTIAETSVSGLVNGPASGTVFTNDGDGDVSGSVALATMFGTCADKGYAAFYASLSVIAHVTNGSQRLGPGFGYDSSAGFPFAIAPST